MAMCNVKFIQIKLTIPVTLDIFLQPPPATEPLSCLKWSPLNISVSLVLHSSQAGYLGPGPIVSRHCDTLKQIILHCAYSNDDK